MLSTSAAVVYAQLKVEIWLLATKSDPEAATCKRAWGCLCPDKARPLLLCPFHAALRQRDRVLQYFGDGARSMKGLPVFPTKVGNSREQTEYRDFGRGCRPKAETYFGE